VRGNVLHKEGKVPFHGDVIDAVQDERGVWVPATGGNKKQVNE
jgi:hypothetical protein